MRSKLEDDSIDVVENNSDEYETGAAFLIRLLRYLETPQYLRKGLFPKHNRLRFVGLLPPLDAPHHLRYYEWASYKEGKFHVENIFADASDFDSKEIDPSLYFIRNVMIDKVIEPGRRVTVVMGTNPDLDTGVQIVPSSRPREEGMYWGYKVRYASNISSVFKNCPYKEGYDKHGLVIKSSEPSLPSFRWSCWVGRVSMTTIIEDLQGGNVRDACDLNLNTCPHQGSRTIQTEEAILISIKRLFGVRIDFWIVI